MTKTSWKEFRDTGLLWWINRQLHLFGWAIVIETTPDNEVIEVYPAKVGYRGFHTDAEEWGYQRVTKYLSENIKTLEEQVLDND